MTYKKYFFLIVLVEHAKIQAYYYEGNSTRGRGILKFLSLAFGGLNGKRKKAKAVGSSQTGNVGYSLLGFTIFDRVDGNTRECLVSDCTQVVSEKYLKSFFVERISQAVLVTFMDLDAQTKSTVYTNIETVGEEEAYKKRVAKIVEEVSRRSTKSDDDPEPGNNDAAQQASNGQPFSSGESSLENQEEETQHMHPLGTLVLI